MPGLQFYYSAFWTLSSDRQTGMGEGRIPWTAVNEYSLRYGLDEYELDHLWLMITAMDGEYLKFANKKASGGIGEDKSKPKNTSSARPPVGRKASR